MNHCDMGIIWKSVFTSFQCMDIFDILSRTIFKIFNQKSRTSLLRPVVNCFVLTLFPKGVIFRIPSCHTFDFFIFWWVYRTLFPKIQKKWFPFIYIQCYIFYISFLQNKIYFRHLSSRKGTYTHINFLNFKNKNTDSMTITLNIN